MLTYPDGTIYQGRFVADQPLGQGVYYFVHGATQKGEFIEVYKAEAQKTVVWHGGEFGASTAH